MGRYRLIKGDTGSLDYSSFDLPVTWVLKKQWISFWGEANKLQSIILYALSGTRVLLGNFSGTNHTKLLAEGTPMSILNGP